MSKHGGSLVINQTEALVSVDVNTGKFRRQEGPGGHGLPGRTWRPFREIVRQLRLRNLGGIIVVDFIDMADEAHRNEVMALLGEEPLRDRNHARAERISAFGLVEMTRKRTGPSLERQLTESCAHCQGMGRMLSAETVMLKAYREMARQGEHLRGATVRLSVHPDLRAALSLEMREGMLAMVSA
ncbi:MAG: ribonuclease E/G, partial [Holophagaceae bacterium]|nr:ribonuclease E/G [Holophagaceae bacterium]